MRKITYLLAVVSVLCFTQNSIAQEELEFIEARQKLADSLTLVKDALKENDWAKAQKSFDEAKQSWHSTVKPMIIKGRKKEIEGARKRGIENPEDAPGKFKEYSIRISEVEENFDKLAQALKGRKDKESESIVNAIIWGISHQPRGFEVPKRTYSVWDWVFGLGIGLGWCVFAIFFGLYLRRSYYRRYKKLQI